MKSLSDIQKELGVEILVLMGQSKTTNKASSIATLGLCGCTCVVAEKGSEVFLGHYPPTDFQKLHADVQAFSPEKVTIFTPGEYVEKGDSWVNTPKRNLLPHLQPTVFPYSEMVSIGETLFDRAVIYRNGSIVHSPVTSDNKYTVTAMTFLDFLAARPAICHEALRREIGYTDRRNFDKMTAATSTK